jgi:hypothetical protein
MPLDIARLLPSLRNMFTISFDVLNCLPRLHQLKNAINHTHAHANHFYRKKHMQTRGFFYLITNMCCILLTNRIAQKYKDLDLSAFHPTNRIAHLANKIHNARIKHSNISSA